MSQMNTYSIVLNSYEVANLRSLLEAAEATKAKRIPPNPFSLIHNGEWVTSIYAKLPLVSRRPNQTALQLAKAAMKCAADLLKPPTKAKMSRDEDW